MEHPNSLKKHLVTTMRRQGGKGKSFGKKGKGKSTKKYEKPKLFVESCDSDDSSTDDTDFVEKETWKSKCEKSFGQSMKKKQKAKLQVSSGSDTTDVEAICEQPRWTSKSGEARARGGQPMNKKKQKAKLPVSSDTDTTDDKAIDDQPSTTSTQSQPVDDQHCCFIYQRKSPPECSFDYHPGFKEMRLEYHAQKSSGSSSEPKKSPP